jgi:hypothetical protein
LQTHSTLIVSLSLELLNVVLAQSKYFEDEAFMNYLEYLEYFRKREYAKFITYHDEEYWIDFRYPTCLHILTLLKQKEFRDAIMRADIAKALGDEIFEHFTKGVIEEESNGANGDGAMVDDTQKTAVWLYSNKYRMGVGNYGVKWEGNEMYSN